MDKPDTIIIKAKVSSTLCVYYYADGSKKVHMGRPVWKTITLHKRLAKPD